MDELINALPPIYEGLDAVQLGAGELAGCGTGTYASGCKPGDNFDACNCGPQKVSGT
jgi:hypothetical protein